MATLEGVFRAYLEAPYKDYWAELGRFIHHFSGAEFALVQLLGSHMRLSKEEAGAIFSGLRTSDAKDHTNRLLDAQGKSDLKAMLERHFAQIGVISGIRNNIVHWGAHHDGGPDLITADLLVSNAYLHPRPSQLKEYRISATDLRNMTDDLAIITIAFGLLSEPIKMDAEWKEFIGRPWLYKPPQQSPPPKEKLGRGKGQPPPPPA